MLKYIVSAMLIATVSQTSLKDKVKHHQLPAITFAQLNMAPDDVGTIIKMADKNQSGKITKDELIEAFEKLAHLVQYKPSLTDLGELGYLWSSMDISGAGELNYKEVEQIVRNSPLVKKIREHGVQEMIGEVHGKK